MAEDHAAEDEAADCRQAVETLYHYLDGELTAERRSMIQRHLDECHDCIEAFEFEVELRVAVSRGCRETVPESLIARVAKALEDEGSQTAR
jgi:mycothiol system anti-sigma-R factor